MNFYFSKISDWLLDWVMPRYCFACGIEEEWLCEKCFVENIIFIDEQVCPDCRNISYEGFVCDDCGSRWALDGLLVCCNKNKLLARLVSDFKYKDIYRLEEILGKMFVQDNFLKLFENIDFVTCVPLERKRYWWRGYNQAELLANQVAKKYDIKYLDVIERKRFVRQQVGLSKKERFENVKKVFEVNTCVREKRIVLVDDVCTTMATLNECAKVLKDNGAKSVFGIVLARGL